MHLSHSTSQQGQEVWQGNQQGNVEGRVDTSRSHPFLPYQLSPPKVWWQRPELGWEQGSGRQKVPGVNNACLFSWRNAVTRSPDRPPPTPLQCSWSSTLSFAKQPRFCHLESQSCQPRGLWPFSCPCLMSLLLVPPSTHSHTCLASCWLSSHVYHISEFCAWWICRLLNPCLNLTRPLRFT